MNIFRYFILFCVALVSGSTIISMEYEYPARTHGPEEGGRGMVKTGKKPLDEQYTILSQKYGTSLNRYFNILRYLNSNMSVEQLESFYDEFTIIRNELIDLLTIYQQKPVPYEQAIAKKIASLSTNIKTIEEVMKKMQKCRSY